jgi:hypothetical protein
LLRAGALVLLAGLALFALGACGWQLDATCYSQDTKQERLSGTVSVIDDSGALRSGPLVSDLLSSAQDQSPGGVEVEFTPSVNEGGTTFELTIGPYRPHPIHLTLGPVPAPGEYSLAEVQAQLDYGAGQPQLTGTLSIRANAAGDCHPGWNDNYYGTVCDRALAFDMTVDPQDPPILFGQISLDYATAVNAREAGGFTCD